MLAGNRIGLFKIRQRARDLSRRCAERSDRISRSQAASSHISSAVDNLQ